MTTISEFYRLAREHDSPWSRAYVATCERVAAHPDFASLVREIAVAEAPNGPDRRRLQQNPPTYGAWITRGMPAIDRTPPKPGECGTRAKNRRAYLLALRITCELEIGTSWPQQDAVGTVYAIGCAWVRARLVPTPDQKAS